MSSVTVAVLAGGVLNLFFFVFGRHKLEIFLARQLRQESTLENPFLLKKVISRW